MRINHDNPPRQGRPCYQYSGLLSTEIADERRDSIEVGIAQETRNVLEPGCSIMNLTRYLLGRYHQARQVVADLDNLFIGTLA